MQKKNTKKVRLTNDIMPIEYDLKLHPDLENFTFEGEETITINVLKPTKKITLHSKEIEVTTTSIYINKEKVFAEISYNENSETVTFTFPKALPKGKTRLIIIFKGILNDKMRGFYRSSYIYDGKVHNIATTQFEATDARRAFPCFDEPAHKAVFHVSLVVPKGKSAISNTLPISKTLHEAGYEIIKFAPSPKMSTYLLAFIVGDFEHIEKKSKRGVIVRVYTTPGKIHQASFALDTTVKCLDFYEEYFDIPYPLNTLDMIAIPDFSSLAMENWGAITFREIGLLIDPDKTSTGSKELIAEVIAHELAHQWFGNLVTMEWWTDLWLNEGFASYIPYVVIDKLFPEWNIWERFSTQTQNIALSLDSLLNTHPIEVKVHHPDEIGEIFDAVSYCKGASVIRMLASYLGEEDFRDGLRYYLKKHSYKNTSTIHLWEAFEKISKKPVEAMMQNWTLKGGYPLVRAEIKSGLLTLSQERFFASAISKKKSSDKTKWMIPVPYIENEEYIKINQNETSFFRTAYSKELLELLYKPVANKSLSPIDRLGIVRDLFALSEAGIINTYEVLNFLNAYKDEDNYTVWAEISDGLGYINQMICNTKLKPEFDAYVSTLYENIFIKVGFDKKDGEEHSVSLLRSLILSKMVTHGHTKIINTLKNKFKELENGKKVDNDLRTVLWSVYAKDGGDKEFKNMISKYKSETLHEEKNRIGASLGRFKDKKILDKVVEFALSKDVRIQDTNSILSSVGLNPNGREIFLKTMKRNWKTFVSRYGDGGFTLSYIVRGIRYATDKKLINDYKNFFKKNTAPGAKRSVEQTIERLESNALYLTRELPHIQKFLKNWGK